MLKIFRISDKTLYRGNALRGVEHCRNWSHLRVLGLLRLVFREYLCSFFQRGQIRPAGLAVLHVAAFLLVLLGLAINPTTARADTYIGGPFANENEAALTNLGYDYDALETESEHTALNELVEYGNARYPDYVTWISTFYVELLDVRYYWSKADGFQYADLRDKAKADVELAIENASSYTGGGSGGVTGDYYNFDVYVPYSTKGTYARAARLVGDDGKVYSGFVNSDGTPATDALLPNHILVKVPSAQVDALVSRAGGQANDDGLCFRLSAYTSSSTDTQLELYYDKSGLRDKFKVSSSTLSASGVSYEYYARVDTSSWPVGYYQRCSNALNSVQSPTTNRGYTFDGSTLVINGTLAWQYISSSFSMDTYAAGNQYGTGFVAIAGPLNPSDSPSDWPEITTPTIPEQPELHEPTTAPTYPQQVTYVEPTYVEADISAILDALNEHCVHLQDAIYTGLSNLYSSLAGYVSGEMYLLRSEMYDELSWIYDGLDSHDRHTQFGFERVLAILRNLDTSPDVDLQPVIDAINGLDLPSDPVAADLSTLEFYARDIRDNTTPRTLDFTEFFNNFRAIENLLQDILDAVEGLDLPSDPVATDLTALEHQLVDLTESDYQVLTVRGLLHWINYYSQDIDRKLDTIEDYEDGDGHLYVRGYLRELLTDFDNLMLVLEEWPDYPNLSTVETRLQDVFDSLDDFADNFVSYWHEVRQKMDDILRAIEGLPQDSEPLHWPDSPLVPPLETPDGGGDIIGPLETDPNGYPVMPDWTFWTERPEMDALDEAIDELMTKFPFCTLNDLVTIFTRLVRPAQAPQFDVPVPNPSDWSAPYMLHVDLSELDPVAAVMRMGITLWVTVRLARRSIRMWTHDEYVEGDGA